MRREKFSGVSFALFLMLSTTSNAATITPSTISGHGFAPLRFDILDHSGQYDEMRGDAALDTFFHHEAQVTTGGIKLRLTSISTQGSALQAGLIDYYTITGGTPGEVVSVTGHFLITGNSQSTLHPVGSPHYPYIGSVAVGGGVGLDLSASGTVTGSNPVITGGSVGTGISPFPLTIGFKDVDFDIDVMIPLVVTVDQQFQLSFSTSMIHVSGVKTDMFNTASVSFELPEGMAITSTNGFGTSPVPEPTSLALAGLGLSFIAMRRRR
jgi:hypothetical protein